MPMIGSGKVFLHVLGCLCLFVASAQACKGIWTNVSSIPYVGPVESFTAQSPSVDISSCGGVFLPEFPYSKWYNISISALRGHSAIYFDTCGSGNTAEVSIQLFRSLPENGCDPEPYCSWSSFFTAKERGCARGSEIISPYSNSNIWIVLLSSEIGDFSLNVGLTPSTEPFSDPIIINNDDADAVSTAIGGVRATPTCSTDADFNPDWIGRWFRVEDRFPAYIMEVCTPSGDNAALTIYSKSRGCTSNAPGCFKACGTRMSYGGCFSFSLSPSVGYSYVFIASENASRYLEFTYNVEIAAFPAPVEPPGPFNPIPCFPREMVYIDDPVLRSVNQNATAGIAATCGFLESSSLGHWYRLSPTITGSIYISTCDSLTTIDTQIVAFSVNTSRCNNCGCLSCSAFNVRRDPTYSAACSSGQSVLSLNIPGSSNSTYIFVGAASPVTRQGTYRLTVSRDLPRSSSSDILLPSLLTTIGVLVVALFL